MGEPVKFTIENDVAYGNIIKSSKVSKKAEVYSALEQAIKNLVGVQEGKPNSEAIFVKNEQLASATLSKKLKSMLPADGSFVYKVRKQKDEHGKVIGVRVYKFLMKTEVANAPITSIPVEKVI